MRILLIDNGTRSLNNLEKSLSSHELTAIRFDELEFGNCNFEETSDLIVLSGGSQYPVVGNELRFSKVFELIRGATLPTIGICLGSELIARAYGAELNELDEKITGPRILTVLKTDDPLFSNNPQLQVYESHRWAITSLPPELIGLARSESGYEIIRHTSLPQIGFQFHPEASIHTPGGLSLLTNAIDTLT